MLWTEAANDPKYGRGFPGWNVALVLDGGLAVSREEFTISYFDGEPLGVLEEFVMRCLVDLGPLPDAEIAQVLGFSDETYITPVTKRFRDRRLLTDEDDGRRTISPAMAEALSRRCLFTPKELTTTAWFDRFRRTWLDRKATVIEREYEPVGDQRLPEHSLPPDEGELSAFLTRENGQLHGATIERIVSQRTVGWGTRPITAVALTAVDGDEWWWQVLDDSGSAVPMLCEEAAALGVEEEIRTRLSAEAEATTDVVELRSALLMAMPAAAAASGAEAPAPETPKEASAACRLTRLRTEEARIAFLAAICKAKQQIVLFFPWIKEKAVVGDLMDALASAVRRGVRVFLAYGIGGAEDEETSDRKAIALLRGLNRPTGGKKSKSKSTGFIEVIWTGGSHTKECAFDGDVYMGGSFNLLSFRGQPDKESGRVRVETMIRIEDGNFVSGFLKDAQERIGVALLSEARALAESGQIDFAEQKALHLLALAPDESAIDLIGNLAGDDLARRIAGQGRAVAVLMEGANRNGRELIDKSFALFADSVGRSIERTNLLARTAAAAALAPLAKHRTEMSDDQGKVFDMLRDLTRAR